MAQAFFFLFLDCRAARVPTSNTSRTPSLVLAEHSMYLCALIWRPIASPCSYLIGSVLSLASSARVFSSLRRSSAVQVHVVVRGKLTSKDTFTDTL